MGAEAVDAEELARADDEFMDDVRLNQARVLAGEGSPKILVGSINGTDGPNWHTIHMIRMGASLVSISTNPGHYLRPDRLYCAADEFMPKAMTRLPKKWKPDFYWDAQAERGHYLPAGLGDLDIPTVVSFNHAHFGAALIHMQGMYDCIISPSAFMAKWGDVVQPWGLSWGTMEERIRMGGLSYKGAPKGVTVSCTIGHAGMSKESVRHAVISEMKAIQARRPEWNVVIATGMSQEEYFALLAASKVSINVGTWGSPMTYRPLEIIAQEAALVHVDETMHGTTAKLSEVFNPGWFVEATPETLEASIEKALTLNLWRSKWIEEEVWKAYSYEAVYGKLFKLAGSVQKKPKLSTRDWSRHAFAVNALTGFASIAPHHAGALTLEDKTSALMYLDRPWDVCLWMPKDPEARIAWDTDIARAEEPVRDIYKRYAGQEVYEVVSK